MIVVRLITCTAGLTGSARPQHLRDLACDQFLQLLTKFRLIDFMLFVRHNSRCRCWTQSCALLLVEPPMESLTLTVAVLNLLALRAFLVRLFIAASAAEGVQVLKASLAVNWLFEDFEGRQIVLLARELSNDLLENRALSEWKFTHAIANRSFSIIHLSVFVRLQYPLDEHLEVVGLRVLLRLLSLVPRQVMVPASDDFVDDPAQEVVLECHQLVDFIRTFHFTLRHQFEDFSHDRIIFWDDAKILEVEAQPDWMNVGLNNKLVERVEKRWR